MFRSIPVLLCIWHVTKDEETHPRRKSFPQILEEEHSTPRSPVFKDSEEHRQFCDAFYALIRSTKTSEYVQRLVELRTLSPVEADYVIDTWLALWKKRLVAKWMNQVVHFGLQATSRVEGYHSNLKKWLTSSTGDLLSIYKIMLHCGDNRFTSISLRYLMDK